MLGAIKVREKTRKYLLDEMARVDFSKMYTVEFYVKVFEIGTVSDNSLTRFRNHAKRVQKSMTPRDDDEHSNDESSSSSRNVQTAAALNVGKNTA